MTTPLLIVAVVAALVWSAVAARVATLARRMRVLRPSGTPGPALGPTVEVVVPAHNEEKWIAATVGYLLAQDYPIARVTVVDDHSTDRTGAILDDLAARHPIRVLRSPPRPIGWVGKTWAVTHGAAGSSADWLLFVDADMGLDPRALSTAMERVANDGADLFSIIARPEIRTFWQGAVALPVGLVLFLLYPLSKANDPNSPVAIAAGGFLLVRRSLYEKVGGHEAVRAEIVEDIQLSRAIKEAGGRLSVHLAPDLAWTHMYGTFGDIWRGLRKNAYAGMEYQFRKYVTGAVFGQLVAWSPIVATIAGLALGSWTLALVGAWGWVAMTAATAPSIPFLRVNPLFALAMPIGSLVYTAIATAGVWHHYRGRIIWKDVTFSATEVRAASRPGRGPADAAPAGAAAPSPPGPAPGPDGTRPA